MDPLSSAGKSVVTPKLQSALLQARESLKFSGNDHPVFGKKAEKDEVSFTNRPGRWSNCYGPQR
jgi:hypothetical protein